MGKWAIESTCEVCVSRTALESASPSIVLAVPRHQIDHQRRLNALSGRVVVDGGGLERLERGNSAIP